MVDSYRGNDTQLLIANIGRIVLTAKPRFKHYQVTLFKYNQCQECCIFKIGECLCHFHAQDRKKPLMCPLKHPARSITTIEPNTLIKLQNMRRTIMPNRKQMLLIFHLPSSIFHPFPPGKVSHHPSCTSLAICAYNMHSFRMLDVWFEHSIRLVYPRMINLFVVERFSLQKGY